MAAITYFPAFVFLLVLFANLLSLGSTTKPEPTISASPGVLPYVNAPDISSFFPNPQHADRPMSSAAPPHTDGPVPAPSPGDFVVRKSSTSARLDSAAAIVFVLFCCSFLVTGMVVF